MNTYALAKFIAEADGVDSRKRLQKAVFLLQVAGCKLGADFFLHLYGPYSYDVAAATDGLAKAGILEEKPELQPWGQQYSYAITGQGRKVLEECEKTPEGQKTLKSVSRHLNLFKKLNQVPLWTLELGSTIAFYRVRGGLEWGKAREKTAELKKATPGDLGEAERLAKEIVPGEASKGGE